MTSRTVPLAPARQPLLLPGAPGPATLVEHVFATRTGWSWGDHPTRPRAIAVACGGRATLAGDPGALPPAALTPLANHRVEAPELFLPLLAEAFHDVCANERMLYLQAAPPAGAPHVPHGIVVRRLTAADASQLDACGPDGAAAYGPWEGAHALAASGLGWGAFRHGRVQALVCTGFLGRRYEDLIVTPLRDERLWRLTLACLIAHTADVGARGHRAILSCASHDRPGRLLAWNAGLRLEREFVEYGVGLPSGMRQNPA
ncbi:MULTISPECIES: GNAT family N-acetyltransferase [Streptomyces]|uniref:GNAT family N-acetyltransferase n=1 Tax=Streptomyces TaxID=1883 RepID=UPI002060FC46|nr:MULTISPECIES: GNAT family N-acetyltransferase [Streptomyces]UPT40542.1 GNAT family N-acetyltransferase [Streptomyces sp. WAC00303]WIY74824.1 GNAT family N-acetyltransferase [Streptomyces anulatus]